MKRIILVYGLIAGLIVTASMLVAIGSGVHSIVLGYLSMLVALSMVFVGIKRYRDEQLGGVIRFWPALGNHDWNSSAGYTPYQRPLRPLGTRSSSVASSRESINR